MSAACAEEVHIVPTIAGVSPRTKSAKTAPERNAVYAVASFGGRPLHPCRAQQQNLALLRRAHNPTKYEGRIEKMEHCEHNPDMLDLSGLNHQERKAVIVLVMGILKGDLMLKQRNELVECLEKSEKRKRELEEENAVLKRLLREGACFPHRDNADALENVLGFVTGKFDGEHPDFRA
jgi:hypothetical protein